MIYWYINISIYRYSDILINWYWYWYIGIDLLNNVCLILKIKLISYIMTMTCIHHAHWCSQPQNMTLIHHPRMSHQPNDTKYKICCHYAEMLNNILNHPIKIKHLASWRSLIIRGWVILFRGGGPPVDPRGGGVPVCNKHQGEGEPRRGGAWWVTLSKKGGEPWWVTQRGLGGPWWVIQKGGQGRRGAPPITTKGRGWGAVEALQNTVSPQTVLISKRCVRGACLTTHILY